MQSDPSLCTLPLIPAALLRRHHVHQPNDGRFKANARLLQALWRKAQKLPMGKVTRRESEGRRLGSMLSESAAAAGRNFLSPAVAAWARQQAIYRQQGALIDERRLFSNLLGSMSLAVNLFAPLALDHALASTILRLLLPDLPIATVQHVMLEFSPGRLDPALTGDRTAFDVAVIYARRDGRRGFIGFELKFSEDLVDSAPIADSDHLLSLARSSGLFKNPAAAFLRVNPLAQLFREHLLAYASLARGDFASATFCLVAPRLNDRVQRGASLYAAHLCDVPEPAVPFGNLELETFIEAFARAGELGYANALHDRYGAWTKIDRIIAAALHGKATASWASVPVANGTPVPLLARAA